MVAGGVLLYCPRRRELEVGLDVPAIWASDVDAWGPGQLRLGEKADKPTPGQKRAPCNPDVEVERAGACWVELTKRPPCPAGLYEGNGHCYMPVKAERPPTSITP